MKTDREKLEALKQEYLETPIPPELEFAVRAPFLKKKKSRLRRFGAGGFLLCLNKS